MENKEKELICMIERIANELELAIGYFPSFNKIPSIIVNWKNHISIGQKQRVSNKEMFIGKYELIDRFQIENGCRIVTDGIKFVDIEEMFRHYIEQLLLYESFLNQ